MDVNLLKAVNVIKLYKNPRPIFCLQLNYYYYQFQISKSKCVCYKVDGLKRTPEHMVCGCFKIQFLISE